MRWLCYPVALSVALALFISTAMLIGRAQPLPERVALLHLNDLCKLPCWIGITPGITTVSDAEKRIEKVYPKIVCTELARLANHGVNIEYGLICNFPAQSNRESFSVTLSRLYPTNSRPEVGFSIQNIALYSFAEPFYAYQLIQLFGEPLYMSSGIYDGIGGYNFFYSPQLIYPALNAGLDSIRSKTAIQGRTKVFSLSFVQLTSLDEYKLPKWRGFGVYF